MTHIAHALSPKNPLKAARDIRRDAAENSTRLFEKAAPAKSNAAQRESETFCRTFSHCVATRNQER